MFADTTVKVFASVGEYGLPTVSVSVTISKFPNLNQRAENAGLPSMLEQITEACRDTPEFKKCVILHKEIAEAPQTVTRLASSGNAFEQKACIFAR